MAGNDKQGASDYSPGSTRSCRRSVARVSRRPEVIFAGVLISALAAVRGTVGEMFAVTFHPYSTDSSERETLAYWFALASVGVGYLVFWAARNTGLPWWIDVPSPIAVYLVIHGLFSRFIWRWRVLRGLGIVKIPDLNGVYSGILTSDRDDFQTKNECTMTIWQTWTEIAIKGEFPESDSYNGISGISVKGAGAPVLTFEYFNQPRADAKKDLQAHRGTNWFDVKDDGLSMTGEWYSGRGRNRIGRIVVKRIAGRANEKVKRVTGMPENLASR
jgi:hypothetical protein